MVTEDEDEIPNNEILSNENITLDESISQLDETFENKSSDHDKTMPLDDEIEEEEQSKNDIIEDDEDSVKKKPDVVNIIDDLIDKNGYVRIYEVSYVEKMAKLLTERAKSYLDIFGKKGRRLSEIADIILKRKS